ncbi:MAG: radical SAM protein [Eubacteriaceae bacterium]|nr:radical SAM protein [Eubacteriaceae bacterium]
MKILLLEHPRKPSGDRQNDIANTTLASCLNSGYLAACLLQAGHCVDLVEGYMEHLDYTAIADEVAAFKPEILGVHLVYNWEDNHELFTLITRLKQRYGIAHVTVYGYYPTFAWKEILTRCPAIDSAQLGENELTMVSLANDPKHYETLQGLAFRTPDGFSSSFGNLVSDLDTLPFPIRKASTYPGGEVNIFGSRGCYNNCTFCYINPYYGNASGCPRWRGRSPENIIAEIDQIIAQTDHRYFYFTDPNFYGPGEAGKKRVLKLAALLKQRPITFGIEARANDIDQETTAALVDAGLKNILVGLESGREEVLVRLNKHTTVAQNETALAILRANGIEPNVGFIMFEPDSTLEDLRVNFDFLTRNHLLDRLEISVNVLYHHQIILAGSRSYEELKAAGRLNISDHSVYEADTDYSHPQVADLAALMRQLTNHIFDHMASTWSLSEAGDPATLQRYKAINGLLVQTFGDILNAPGLLEKSDTILKHVTGQIDTIMTLKDSSC